MKLKTPTSNKIVNPMNKLFSNPFRKNTAIIQHDLVHPIPAQIISPTDSPDWCFLKPYAKTELEYERQQAQGITYTRISPLR